MQQTTLRSATYSMELSLKGLSSMLGLMNRHRASRIGQLLLKVGGAALGLVFALIATFRDLFATAYTADEEDDGKEFLMLNLIQLREGKVPHPVTGEKQKPRELITKYFRSFSLAVMKRGGHPVFQARTVGGNIDSWNADSNVGFMATTMMRYKSRRDLIELLIDPGFADSHLFKLAAIERTISYPTQTMFSASLRPPISVLLVLLLLASITQNIAFLLRL